MSDADVQKKELARKALRRKIQQKACERTNNTSSITVQKQPATEVEKAAMAQVCKTMPHTRSVERKLAKKLDPEQYLEYQKHKPSNIAPPALLAGGGGPAGTTTVPNTTHANTNKNDIAHTCDAASSATIPLVIDAQTNLQRPMFMMPKMHLLS